MKILLIQPPVRDFYQTAIRMQPIGLAYLAASLKSHGHEVEILDCQTDKKRSIPIPSQVSTGNQGRFADFLSSRALGRRWKHAFEVMGSILKCENIIDS